MSKVNSKDVGIIYIVIAILCLANFFLGYKLISKVIKNHNNNLESKVIGYEEEAIPAFIAITDDGENIIGSTSNSEELNVEVEIDNFFLKVLLNSSTYMRLAYESEEGVIKDFGLPSFFFGKINFPFTPVTYIKSQFPAILNLVDAKAVSSNNYAIGNDDKSPTILEDIVFYEDPIEEGDEGQIEIGEGDNNVEEVVEIPEAINLDHSNPYILIYHTHGTESFYPAEDDRFHTIDRKYNVTTIGEEIGKVLASKGHNIKHVDIYHDIPSYNKSYARSLETVKSMIQENKSLKIIFDVHRDGVEGDASYIEKAKEQAKIEIDGKNVATFSLVVGPDNPNKDKLLTFAKYIKSVSDKLYPGLCKGIIIKSSGKFNQYVSDYYALVEVGSNLNNMDEAKESSKYIGEILD